MCTEAKQLVIELVNSTGLVAIDLGSLATGGAMHEVGAPLRGRSPLCPKASVSAASIPENLQRRNSRTALAQRYIQLNAGW
jgi:hypothetical protein